MDMSLEDNKTKETDGGESDKIEDICCKVNYTSVRHYKTFIVNLLKRLL